MSQCVICSDNFDDIERVSATPCGHVYHHKCVMQWLNLRNTCPDCRTPITREKIINLYFNLASVHPDNALVNQVEKYKTLLSQATSELATERQKVNEIREIARCKESKNTELQQLNMQLNHDLGCAKRELKDFKKELHIAKKDLDITRNDLKLYSDVKLIVMGTQEEADEILSQFTGVNDAKDSGAAKRLAYSCSLTKRELQKVIADKTKLTSESVKLSQNLFLKTSQLNAANAKIKRLTHRIKEYEKKFHSNSFSKESFHTSDEPRPSTSMETPCTKQIVKESLDLTPIATEFEKPKMNVVIIDKSCKKVNVAKNSFASPQHFSSTAKRLKENDSISNVGYNGLGGHHHVIKSGVNTARSFLGVKKKMSYKH